MLSDVPRSAEFLKGALVAYQSQFIGALPNIIVFQYNPEQLSRSLAARVTPLEPRNLGAAREDVLWVQGTPVETISIKSTERKEGRA